MPKHHNLTLLIILFASLSVVRAQVNPQHKSIKVALNNGESIYTSYVYLYSNYQRSFVRVDSKRGDKIPIYDVKFIEGYDRNGETRYIHPITINGFISWGERNFMSDHIQIYSTSGFDLAHEAKAGSNYIKDDAELKPITYKNLKRDLSDSPESMNYLQKAHNMRLSQLGLRGAAVALFVAGVVQMTNRSSTPGESSGIPPIFIGSGVLALSAYLFEKPKNENMLQALRVYK